jgi:DME family drug/metabolite transporter
MKDLKGYVMVLGASLFWGASATGAKFLLNRQVDTVTMVEARVVFTVLLLFPFLLLYRPKALLVPLRDLWRFLLLGVLGVAGSNFTYYYTIKESTVATGILIQYTAPILVMAYAARNGEEQFSTLKVAAALISLLGCYLAVGAYDFRVLNISPLGTLTGICSIVCFAFLTVYTRKLLHVFPFWTVTFYAIAGAALFWLIIRPPWAFIGSGLSDIPWLGLLALSVASVLIPHSLYFGGLQRLVPSRVIITSTMEPIVAIVSAAVLLGEGLAGLQIVGAALVITAILLLQVRREPERPLQQSVKEPPYASG